jgi:hypothetical protein
MQTIIAGRTAANIAIIVLPYLDELNLGSGSSYKILDSALHFIG